MKSLLGAGTRGFYLAKFLELRGLTLLGGSIQAARYVSEKHFSRWKKWASIYMSYCS